MKSGTDAQEDGSIPGHQHRARPRPSQTSNQMVRYVLPKPGPVDLVAVANYTRVRRTSGCRLLCLEAFLSILPSTAVACLPV